MNKLAVDNDALLWTESVNITKWYQPWELCILNSSSLLGSAHIRDGECSNHAPKDDMKAFRCRAGGLFKRIPCRLAGDPPFSSKKHLLKAVVGYDNPSTMYLQSFVQNVIESSASLLFIGDSFMRQLLVAITCELEREQIKKFTWDELFDELLVSNHSVPLRLKRIDTNTLENSDMLAIEKYINDTFVTVHENSLFIVFNIGLHFQNLRMYKQKITLLFTYFSSLASSYPSKRFVICWMETISQHFNTTIESLHVKNGYWSISIPKEVSNEQVTFNDCVPIRDSGIAYDWRNLAVRDYLDIHSDYFNDSNVIFVTLPMRALTLPLHDTHNRGGGQDCTHYCWSPMMYQAVFHFLSEASSELLNLR